MPYATISVMHNDAAASSHNHDGTLTATVVANPATDLGRLGRLLRVRVPIPLPTAGTFGRYVLVRCAATSPSARALDWTHYARRALFSAGPPTAAPNGDSTWDFWLPSSLPDSGLAFLRQSEPGDTLNLIGPLGRPIDLPAHQRALVILTDDRLGPLTLPLLHSMLDQGGRVALVWYSDDEPSAALRAHLPLAVELRRAATRAEFQKHADDLVRWADRLVATADCSGAITPGDPAFSVSDLSHLIRNRRYRLESGFADVLVESDLVCGYGACLTCVVPAADGGLTRACLHGPVLPLHTIAR